MKEHPKELPLIEADPVGMWRLVRRETTWCGLKRGPMPVEATYPCIEQARGHLKKLKSSTYVIDPD